MLITSFSTITVRVLTALPTTLLLVSTAWTVPSTAGVAFSTATPAYGIKHRHCPAFCCVPAPAPATPLPTLVVKGLTTYAFGYRRHDHFETISIWQFSLEHVPQTFGSQQQRCLNRRPKNSVYPMSQVVFFLAASLVGYVQILVFADRLCQRWCQCRITVQVNHLRLQEQKRE